MHTRLAPDERRAQVLDAARRVFAHDGFAEASTAAVAREAGVTRGLVHHYFGSRRALFLAVLAELADRLPAAIRTDLGGLSVEETVKVNSSALLDAVERDREAWRALLGATGPDPEVQAILDRARDEAVERMLVNQATPGGGGEELRLVLRVFLGAAEAALAEWVLRDRATRDQTQALLEHTLLAMVGEVLPRVAEPRG